MGVVNLNTIKNWFKTGLKPTQAQFWDTWDSFRHKQEKVPVADIEGIDALLQSKADSVLVNQHTEQIESITEILPNKQDRLKNYTENGNPEDGSIGVVIGDHTDSHNGTKVVVDDYAKSVKISAETMIFGDNSETDPDKQWFDTTAEKIKRYPRNGSWGEGTLPEPYILDLLGGLVMLNTDPPPGGGFPLIPRLEFFVPGIGGIRSNIDFSEENPEELRIYAQRSYVVAKIAELVDSSPEVLNTLNKLAEALGNDPNFATTTAEALGNRLRFDTDAQGLTNQQKTNVKTNIDLENVENTADADKPVSTATQMALGLKAAKATTISINGVSQSIAENRTYETRFVTTLSAQWSRNSNGTTNLPLTTAPTAEQWDTAIDWAITWKDGNNFRKISGMGGVSDGANALTLINNSGTLQLNLANKGLLSTVTIPSGANLILYF